MDITLLFGISLTTLSIPFPVLVYWRIPLVESYKVNTNGCVKDGFTSEWGIIRNLSDLWIEFNSTLAIHCITRGGGPWSIQATLRHIRHLIAFDRDTISHIILEGNQVTDLLTSENWNSHCYF
ncbi:Uncharacterized protein Adt_47033 [Abeliophyllum distichum]|uniref:Uncharacterized protein n=1 Tax=Abeliophyllum distichum TaxID=126358 RepID=A0ABD1NWD9_9LAMI